MLEVHLVDSLIDNNVVKQIERKPLKFIMGHTSYTGLNHLSFMLMLSFVQVLDFTLGEWEELACMTAVGEECSKLSFLAQLEGRPVGALMIVICRETLSCLKERTLVVKSVREPYVCGKARLTLYSDITRAGSSLLPPLSTVVLDRAIYKLETTLRSNKLRSETSDAEISLDHRCAALAIQRKR